LKLVYDTTIVDAPAADARIRAETPQARTMDKGLDRFMRHFDETEAIAAIVWAEIGLYG
jgi:hypothetical protein